MPANALGTAHLLEGASRQYGVLPALRLPLFEGGRLQAQLGGREADRDGAVALYQQTVLDAVREAADAIRSQQGAAAQAAEQARALLDSFGRPHTDPTTSGPTHIFNLGHGISQYTPPEHVAALVEAVHSHSRAMRRAA